MFTRECAVDVLQGLEPRLRAIVTAVLDIADRFGTGALTTRRIAQHVGFVEGALYRHIRSKREIFRLILTTLDQIYARHIADLRARDLDPRAYLEQLFTFIMNALAAYPGLMRLVFSDELHRTDPDAFQHFRSFIRRAVDDVARVLRDGVARGRFRPDLHVEDAAILYMGLVRTAYLAWDLIHGRQMALPEMGRRLLEIYFHALAPPEEAEPC